MRPILRKRPIFKIGGVEENALFGVDGTRVRDTMINLGGGCAAMTSGSQEI